MALLNTNVTRLMTLSASVLLAFATTAVGAADGEKTTSVHATPAAAQPAKPATQADKDLEHNMVQGEGFDHPREILKDGKAKKPAVKAAPRNATQRDLDQEHDRLQGDSRPHPREVVGDGKAAKQPATTTAPVKKTQKDLDQEHDRLQGDGAIHPREVIK